MINNCEKRILYWGLPHVVFLAIASITALQVSYDFSDDSFVKVTVFIISFILLSFSYIIVQNMIYYLFTIICSIWKRNNKSLSSNLMTKKYTKSQRCKIQVDEEGKGRKAQNLY